MSKNEETKTLDAVVEKYGLSIKICPNRSSHIDRGMNIPSDMMFEHDSMFLVKRIAYMSMGITQETIRAWSPEDCKDFYLENKIATSNTFRETFLDGEKGIGWYFQGRSNYYMTFLEYRWDNGMIFTNYKERVNMALEFQIKEVTTDASDIIDKVRDLEEQRSVLNNELKKLVASDSMSDRLKNILSNVDIGLSDLD